MSFWVVTTWVLEFSHDLGLITIIFFELSHFKLEFCHNLSFGVVTIWVFNLSHFLVKNGFVIKVFWRKIIIFDFFCDFFFVKQLFCENVLRKKCFGEFFHVQKSFLHENRFMVEKSFLLKKKKVLVKKKTFVEKVLWWNKFLGEK